MKWRKSLEVVKRGVEVVKKGHHVVEKVVAVAGAVLVIIEVFVGRPTPPTSPN